MTFDMLEVMGLPVYIWKKTSATDGDLIRWPDFKGMSSDQTRIGKKAHKEAFLHHLAEVRQVELHARSKFSSAIKQAIAEADHTGNHELEDALETFFESLEMSSLAGEYVDLPVKGNPAGRAANKLWVKLRLRNPNPAASSFILALIKGQRGQVAWVTKEVARHLPTEPFALSLTQTGIPR